MKPTNKKITPIRKQYLDIKNKHPKSILFFRLGDFYETFDTDAKIISDILGIVLTSRKISKHESVPMAGIPYHSLDNHLKKLLNNGLHVAICEQQGNDPNNGIMQRKVVRTYTPGTLTDPTMMDENRNNYLAAISFEDDQIGIAHIDISTGYFKATEFSGNNAKDQLINELNRISPAEVLVSDSNNHFTNQMDFHITTIPNWVFNPKNSRQLLMEQTETSTLAGYGLKNRPLAISAAGAIVFYMQETQVNKLELLNGLSTYNTKEFMLLDETTRLNLELTKTLRAGKKQASLLHTIDRTITPMGGRLLHQYIQQPLVDLDKVNERLDNVSIFVENTMLRKKLRKLLKQLTDIERLTNRLVNKSANPQTLKLIKNNLIALPDIKDLISIQIRSISQNIDCGHDIVKLIKQSMIDDPPINMDKPGFIKPGWSMELDKIHESSRDAINWIEELEDKERNRTGIKSLKVGFNKVFGYYIEISKSSGKNIPDEYIRKQTLVNAERYITPELKHYETIVLDAKEQMLLIEKNLFYDICNKITKESHRLLLSSQTLAQIDVLSSLAETAIELNYVRPEMQTDNSIEIKNSRHPVVEQHLLNTERFVPNDCLLNAENNIWIITGPNMSGKSTFLRQVALCVLLAQIGSYIPADSAKLGIVDRIFTRIGAQDEIHAGQSTFMVEMVETANILNHATPNSLLILDEIGRGTSTYDGLAIAWAIVKYIHDNPQLSSKTLFATHYHELLGLEHKLSRVKNYNVSVSDTGESLVFTHNIIPGGANRSYGVHVAQLAGLPKQIIENAYDLLINLEHSTHSPKLPEKDLPQKNNNTNKEEDKIKIIDKLNLDSISPLEALQILYKLKQD